MAKIVIDAGHGGKDPGAVGQKGTKEKDITLKIAVTVASLLQQADIATKLTRTSDVFVELGDRAKIANSFGANLFVSIHCNSATDRSANGIETYCYEFGGEGEKLARIVQQELVAATGLKSRADVKAANFAVLRETAMPAILVELCFISNPAEEALLNNPSFQTKCAKAIVDGILKYLGISTVKPTAKKEKEEDDTLDKIVVYYGDADLFAAVLVSQKYKCPLMRKADYDASGIKAKQVIEIGGKPGSDRFTTFKDAAKLV